MDKSIKSKPVFFAIILPDLQRIAIEHGYNAVPHNSFSRDFDLICIAWTDNPKPRWVLLKAFAKFLGTRIQLGPDMNEEEEIFNHSVLPGRRNNHIIHVNHGFDSFGDHSRDQWYLDISFTPCK